MAIPRVLFVLPGLLAGLLVPALTSTPKTAPVSSVGMISTDFTRDSVRIHEGGKITLFNSSDVIHVIGPGRYGKVAGIERHVPLTGFHLMPTNSTLTIGPWKTPGTYYLTCSVHPHMTLKVIVIR